jgi:hypothetical protein
MCSYKERGGGEMDGHRVQLRFSPPHEYYVRPAAEYFDYAFFVCYMSMLS